MYTHVAVLIAGLVAGGSTIWKVQEWRHDAIDKDRAEQALADQRLQAKAALRREESVIDAQNKAQARARSLRMDADGSRAALIGLSSSADEAMRAAAASHDACTVRATAFSQLLNQCGAAYQELGAAADRHASDVRTLTEAWPK